MDIGEIKGIGPKKKELLNKIGIFETEDMLRHYPVSYENRSEFTPVAELKEDGIYYICASVKRIYKSFRTGAPQAKQVLRLKVADDSGELDIIFFNARFLAKSFEVGRKYNFFGRVTAGSKDTLQMAHPDFELPERRPEHPILPVYRSTKGITQKELRRISEEAISVLSEADEFIPEKTLSERHICGIEYAMRNIHFPSDRRAYLTAKYRLIFEELFLLESGLMLMKGTAGNEASEGSGIAFPKNSRTDDFTKLLHFELTGAQKRVLSEVEADMRRPVRMQRLIQGDVGSGKTAIAAAVLYKAAKDGYQGVLMAPTELLAHQHFETLRELYGGTGIRLGYLSSAVRAKAKKETLNRLMSGDIDVLAATHAVLQENVSFKKLGIVITDEQHRFGVNQRVTLSEKGESPDILVMTATPIPRSLAVIAFGNMDISVIDELPAGRRKIITKAVSEKSRKRVYEKAAELMDMGQRVYVTAPLISDSEELGLRSAEGLYAELTRLLGGYSIGLVHGAMSQYEKDRVMGAFASGEIQMLVATVVIEVGINVPEATMMIIENAERFGLAQLHQLRGRVGRGSEQSYCILVTDMKSELGKQRAEILENSDDGFEIAEMDLEMRGPGDLLGTRQHGLPRLFIADFVKNADILKAAAEEAKRVIGSDPGLASPENKSLRAGIERMFENRGNIGI